MKRKIINIDSTKWYHIESLKKFFAGYNIEYIKQSDANGTEFTFIKFKRLWGGHTFIVHPKTKRLRKNFFDALEEAGFAQ